MKKCVYVYKTSKGEYNLAMSSEMFLTIVLVFLALPFIAFGYWLWHMIKGNVELITREEYYKQRMTYHKRQER